MEMVLKFLDKRDTVYARRKQVVEPMGKIKLLDCTLRDGGYINDWHFGHDTLVRIFERLADAGTDIIEIGFLDERRTYDPDRSILPDTASVDRVFGKLDKRNAKIVGMIDYGACSLSRIAPARKSCLDGIRVIFKKHLRKEALEFCTVLKEMGYTVFAQLVSVTSYTDEEMMDLVRLANEARPYAVSIVDTYGLMHQNNLRHYFEILNRHLRPETGIGYHGHNNLQMGYANCIEFLRDSAGDDRTVIVDGTLFGMGKSAGNTPIELIAMHLNERYGKQYDISQLLEAIDTCLSPYCVRTRWGYDLPHFISAYNDCHPDYVTWLTGRNHLSITSVNEILSGLDNEKKLHYDEAYICRLYQVYLEEKEHRQEVVGS